MTLQVAGAPILAATVNRQYTYADNSVTTVTTATAANLCTAYTIPGSDASQFTCYRLAARGYGTWGSTQQKLTLSMALAGVTIGSTPAIASTAFSASAAFDWRLIFELTCCSTGTSGTWLADLTGIFAETSNAELPGTAADNSVSVVGVTHSAITQDTTSNAAMAIQAVWASVTGAPTITCVSTKWERLSV